MSHVVLIKANITDLEVVASACKRLGFHFHLQQKTFRWYGTWLNDFDAALAAHEQGIDPKDYGKCDHAISIPGANYEVGLLEREGSYQLLFDFYEHAIKEQLGGEGAPRFLQAYAVEAALKQARSQGYLVHEQTLEDGTITLQLTEVA